jgi:hypothetical protein
MESNKKSGASGARRAAPPDYFRRGEQWRLMLALVIVAGLPLAAFEVYNWSLRPAAGLAGGPPLTAAEVAQSDPDTLLRSPPDAHGPDEVDRFVAPGDGPPGGDPGGAAIDPAAPRQAIDPAAPRQAYYPGVRAEYLAQVQDNTVFRSDERDAWYHLLAILDRAELPALEAASEGRVGFVQLFQQPASYRGRLVTIRGTVRRAHRLIAPKNEYGIESYYQCWLEPAGGPSSPLVVYVLDMPAGFPAGMQISEEVEYTGFSYKRWAYQAGDGTRTTPVILAKIGRWAPAPPVRTPLDYPVLLAAAVAVAALLGVALAVFVYRQSQVRPAVPGLDRIGGRAPSFHGVEAGTSVEEMLARLAREEEGNAGRIEAKLARPGGDDSPAHDRNAHG